MAVTCKRSKFETVSHLKRSRGARNRPQKRNGHLDPEVVIKKRSFELLESSRHNSFFKAGTMGVVTEPCLK